MRLGDMLRLALVFVVVILSSAAANDFWLTPEEGIGDGLAGLLGGGGGGIATKTVCGFRVAEGPKDIFQCYTPGDDGICRRGGFYASITRLPAVGKIDV